MPLYRTTAGVVFFAHIPKTGGTSVEKTLKVAGASEAMKFRKKIGYSKATMQHMHAAIYREAVGKDFADYSFTVVRNPYDRFASEYKMKVLDAGAQDPVHEWAKVNFNRFEEFSYTRDNHIRPQIEFVSKRVEVFTFENGLQAPVEAACKHLELEVPELRHEKRGSKTRLPITTKGLIAISNFYRDDFKKFGYDLDDYENSFELVNEGEN